MKPSEILKAALAKLEGGKRWTKLAGARDIRGRVVDIRDPKAYSFCAMGAVLRVQRVTDAFNYLYASLPSVFPAGITQYNDSPKCEFKHVRALFCKAIRMAEENGE